MRKYMINCDKIPAKVWDVLTELKIPFTITTEGIELESAKAFKLVSYEIKPPSEKIKHIMVTKEYHLLRTVQDEIKELEKYEGETFYRLMKGDLYDPLAKFCKGWSDFSKDEKEKMVNFVFPKVRDLFYIEDWDKMIEITVKAVIDAKTLSPSEVRAIKYAKCKLCESEDICENASVSDCRKKLEQNSFM